MVGAIIVGAQKSVSIRQLVTGYCRAFYRFQAEQQVARHLPDADDLEAPWAADPFMALFEALNWADATDEFLERGPTGRGGKLNWLDNLAEDQRKVVRGMRHARNVVHHQWWAALATRVVWVEGRQVDTWILGKDGDFLAGYRLAALDS